MRSSVIRKLVKSTEKLLIRQQLNLWNFLDADYSLRQKITNLQINLGHSSDENCSSSQTEINAIKLHDEVGHQILMKIERIIARNNIHLYELIENEIELQLEFGELRAHQQRTKTEAARKDEDGWINHETDNIAINRQQQLCNLCGKTLLSKITLRNHMLSHSNGRNFECPECGKQFVRKDYLAAHIRTCHNSNRETKYRCNECDKTFYTKVGFDQHTLIHIGTKSFECIVCKRLFYTMNQLKKHTKEVHLKLYKKSKLVHACSQCDKIFTTRYFLKAHSYKHTEQIFECDQCKKIYSTPDLLKRHKQNMHNGIDSVTCEICNVKLASMSSYKCHKYYEHTSVKVYRCEFCERTFKRLQPLTKHRFTHTGEKPFQCDICGKAFTTQARLTIHQRIHTGEKPYSCQICQRKFSNSEYLRSHMKNVHKTIK